MFFYLLVFNVDINNTFIIISMKCFIFILNVLFSVAMVTCMPSYSQHQRFINILSEISHNAIVIEFILFLFLSSFWPENSTLV